MWWPPWSSPPLGSRPGHCARQVVGGDLLEKWWAASPHLSAAHSPGATIAARTGHSRRLQPAPYARAALAVGVAQLALEIGFLASHHAVANGEGEGHEHHQ